MKSRDAVPSAKSCGRHIRSAQSKGQSALRKLGAFEIYCIAAYADDDADPSLVSKARKWCEQQGSEQPWPCRRSRLMPAKIIQLPREQQGKLPLLHALQLCADTVKLCNSLGAEITIKVAGDDHASETVKLLLARHGVLAE